MENVLTKIVVNVAEDCTITDIIYTLYDHLPKYENIYSYLIYYKPQQHLYRVEINISNIDKYNTYKRSMIVDRICEDFAYKQPNDDNILSWLQPPIDITVEAFEPLVCKLSKQQAEAWTNFEYDDLCQMCRMCIVLLNSKGYYINPKLITRTFINEILMILRKHPTDTTFVSFDTPLNVDSDDKELTLADTIPDTSLIVEQADNDEHEVNLSIMNELKDIIVDIIGARGYEQLLKEYGTHQTSAWGRKTLQQLKYKLKEMGYTKEKYIKYYGG